MLAEFLDEGDSFFLGIISRAGSRELTVSNNAVAHGITRNMAEPLSERM